MKKVHKSDIDYSFLEAANLAAAVVDIEATELIYITPAAAALFSVEGNGETQKTWFKKFLNKDKHRPDKWIKIIDSQGISIENAFINNKKCTISATILNKAAANVLLIQFHRNQSVINETIAVKKESWKELVNNIPEGIVIHHSGMIVFMNAAAEELLEIKAEKQIGKPFLSLFTGEAKKALKNRMDEWIAEANSEYFEFPYKRPSGKELYLGEQTVEIRIDGQPARQTMLTNLSLRKKWIHEKMRAQLAEEINQILKHEIKEHKITQYELEQAKNFNLALIESSMDMIIAENNEGKISVFNKAAEKQYGYNRHEIIGKPTSVLFAAGGDYKKLKKNLADEELVSLVIENKRKNGEKFTSYLSASQLYTTDGIYLGSMGVSRDISEEKQSEENLKKSEEMYRDLFDNMSDAYLLTDARGNLKYWNKAGLELLAVSEKRAATLNLLECVDKGFQQKVKEDRKRMKLSGKTLKGQEYVLINGKKQRRYVQVNSSPIYEKGKFTGSRELLRDISDQKKAIAQADSHSAKIKAIFESTAYMIWSVDKQKKLTSFNVNYAKVYKKLTGKSPKIGQPATGLSGNRNVETKKFWKDKYDMVFEGKPQSFETSLKDETGKLQWFEVDLNPIIREDGEVEELSGISQSVTFKKQAEGKIKDQAAKINSIFDSTAMLIWTVDINFRITSYNANFAKMLQRNFGIEIQIGMDYLKVLKPFIREDLREGFMNLYCQAIEGKYVQFEGPAKKKNGHTIWMESFLNPIFKEDNSVAEVSCMAHEVTDKKIIEKQIRESLREKEILLQEVHHRVKNNLQVISSILNLQSSYVKDPNTLSILRESQNRIKSMSFIHESLYQTTDFSSIDFSDYILSLSKNLLHSYSIKAGLIELDAKFDKVYLNLDQAIPCGLIVNELVSNALKYAFPNNQKGVLTMKIREVKNKVELMIKDNGVGVPADFDFDHADTLGLQLVYTLIEQLDGEVAFDSKPEKGTEYLITFDKIN